MMVRTALVTLSTISLLNLTPVEAIKKPYVETYWESWIPSVSLNFELKTVSNNTMVATVFQQAMGQEYTSDNSSPHLKTFAQEYPDDFAAFLKDVPVGPPGSCAGVGLLSLRSQSSSSMSRPML